VIEPGDQLTLGPYLCHYTAFPKDADGDGPATRNEAEAVLPDAVSPH
jgi:hypothetical protein